MKKEKNEKKEEFIIYKYEDEKEKNEENKKIYDKIAKVQKKNAKILSIAVFLYCFSITYFFTTLDFFIDKEQEVALLLTTLLIDLVASILIIYCNKKKPKEGRIIYKYKNGKSFILALILSFLGVIIIFSGLDNLLMVFIGLTLLDVSISLDVYHDKTGGNMKPNLLKDFVISFFVCIIAIIIGSLINPDVNNDDYLYEYYKASDVVYDEIDRPALITKGNNLWYIFTNRYKSNHYELSVNNKPENLNIVYEIDDVKITNVNANDNYAVWSEYSPDKLTYAYYDKEENQTYELISLPYSENEPQKLNVELYDDKIYYEVIDYQNNNISLMVYDIVLNETNTLYTINNTDKANLTLNTIRVEENNLMMAICYNGVLQIIHFDLNKYMDKNYKPTVINTKIYYVIPLGISYDNGKYALYYADKEKKEIVIINKEGKVINNKNTFKNNNYVFYEKIKLKDEKLYYVNYEHDDKMSARDFKLVIHNLKNKHKSEVKNIFDFYLDKKNIYGLGYYKNKLKNVRLYKINN